MATQTPAIHTPSAQVVGNAFVEQYYHILHQSPELVYRFYTDSSVLSRPGPDGNMTQVKTMQAINKVILSLDYKDYKAEIQTIDSQESYKEGVVVLVTGWLTVKDNVKRRFTQSFFLAPQEKGFFVLNDAFRYVDEYNPPEPKVVPVNGVTENIQAVPITSLPVTSVPVTAVPVTPEPEPTHIPEQPVPDNTTPAVEVPYGNGEVVHEPSDNGEVSVVETQVVDVPVHSSQNGVRPESEPVSAVQEDTPKKSYASIVKVKATSPAIVATTPRKVAAGTAGKLVAGTPGKVAISNGDQQSTPAPAPDASAPASTNGKNNNNILEEVEGYSIYIRSLPSNASVQQVEDEFKKFGAIRPNGVQVRSNKQNFCFGFVEFVSLESKKNAIEASPITIGNRQAYVEEKRTQTRVGPNGRPRLPPGRTSYRNDNFRGGRGNFGGGGRGYGRSDYGNRVDGRNDYANRGDGRNDYGNRGDFSGRRGPAGRGGDGYQRVEYNVGNGRIGRQGGMSQTAITA